MQRRAPALAQRRELHIEQDALGDKNTSGLPPSEEEVKAAESSETPAEQQSGAVEPSVDNPSETAEIEIDEPIEALSGNQTGTRGLPITCTGCGAFSQTEDPKQFGYYNPENKRVRRWLSGNVEKKKRPVKEEENIVNQALASMSPEQLKELGLDPATMLRGELPDQESSPKNSPAPKSLVCDRCHSLEHNNSTDIQMFHPTVDSLRATIEESPHKYNHIYHIIDAADFPMSLVPRLNVLLGDIRLRTKNRRSRVQFVGDRKIEMSFVITRGDLLGPTKESVDRLMPWLQKVLRDALGRLGDRVRLGNVTCVSAKRGWWTKHLKERIWHRGGAAWMVGKVNVGKSQLFEAVYPKGRIGDTKANAEGESSVKLFPRKEDVDQEVGDLLPPLQPLQQYPDMPMVSSLPGTTASPIRVPFGKNKGELIDLPGLARSDLEFYVRPEHRKDLVMKSRIVPEQRSVSATKSLVLGGGLIRITPASQDLHFLMYNFTPLHDHLTSTSKAIDMQNQLKTEKSLAWTPGMENIGIEGLSHKMHHAGRFQLKHDVSKMRAGPLTRKDAINLTVDRLHFRVLSLDILIEGVGYVEVVCQVRKSYLEHSEKANLHWATKRQQEREASVAGHKAAERAAEQDPFGAISEQRRTDISQRKEKEYNDKFNDKNFYLYDKSKVEPDWPAVDVFSPMGRFIGTREPIQGWLRNKPLVKPEHRTARPRKSAKGEKKREKQRKRAASTAVLDSVFAGRSPRLSV